jgi:flagellar basal body rod protein FlgC
MATRGTYQFIDDDTKTTIYVHWDNYLDGAAKYFYGMLVSPSKGNLATQFIRAVDSAEITRSHARHGDTEFQYNIKGSDGNAELMVKNPCANIVVYKGTLVDFIEKHKRLIENYKPLKKYVNEWGYVQYVTVDMARKIIEGKLKTMEVWKEKNVNKDFVVEYEEQIKSIVEYFPELKEYKGVINV